MAPYSFSLPCIPPLTPLTTTSSSPDFQPLALLASPSIGSPLIFPIVLPLSGSTHTYLPRSITHGVPRGYVIFLILSFLTFSSSPWGMQFQIFSDYTDISFIPTPMTFNSTSTIPITPLIPPTDSPLASTPYTNGLLPTPLNVTSPKTKLSFSTYPYVPPLSLNHPHHTKHEYPLLL